MLQIFDPTIALTSAQRLLLGEFEKWMFLVSPLLTIVTELTDVPYLWGSNACSYLNTAAP